MKPLSVMSKHDCSIHGHHYRVKPLWGNVCVFCGGRPPQMSIGTWHKLGEHSRIWVSK